MSVDLNNYPFAEFDSKSIAATRKAWLKYVELKPDDFSKHQWDRRLERLEGMCNYDKGSEFSYGIFNDGTKIAYAIIEMSYTRESSKWMKMLNLHLCPELDLSVDSDTPNFEEIACVFTSSIMGSLKLTGKHKCRVLKLYGRTPVLLSFFKYLAADLRKDLEAKKLSGFEVSIEGRWLVINVL